MQKTDTTSQGNNNFAKQTFLKLGYNEEDVHTVFRNETDYIPFVEVREKLEKLKEKRKNYDFDDINVSGNKQTMIVVSSESDSDDGHEEQSQSRYNYSSTHHSNIVEHNLNHFSNDGNESDALKFAKLDMPQHDKLVKWFTSNFRPVYEGVVFKDDMFKRFCDHFHAPPYLTLQELFFEEIDLILKTDIACRNHGIECIEDQYFENLEISENTEERLTNQLKKALRIDKKVPKIYPTLPGTSREENISEKLRPNPFGTTTLKTVPKKIDEPSKILLAANFNNVKRGDDSLGAYVSRIRDFKFYDSPSTAGPQLNTKAEMPAPSYKFDHCSTSDSNSTATPLVKTVIKKPSTITNSESATVIGGKQKETILPIMGQKTIAIKVTPASTKSNKTVDTKPNTNKTTRSRRKSPTTSKEKKITVKETTVSSYHVNQIKELPPNTKTDYSPSHYQTPVPERVPSTAFIEDVLVETDKLDLKSASNQQLLNLPDTLGSDNLRPIIIDGSNLAREHGNGSLFSCRGIALCVRYFWLRGHREITCFVPNFRKGPTGNPRTIDNDVLFDLEKKNICKFTPSRKINGKLVVSYDDRFILNLAESNKGVIVSNDQYRDLLYESREFKKIIETRLLPFVFVDDLFMPAPDPLGRNGPNLNDFLKLPVNSRSNRKKQQNSGAAPFVEMSSRNGCAITVKRSNVQPSKRQDASNNSPARVDAIVKCYPTSISQTSASFAKPVPKTRQKKLQKEADRNPNALTVGSPTCSTSSSESELTDEEQWNKTRNQLIVLFPDKQLQIDTLHALHPTVMDLNELADLLLQDDGNNGVYI